MARLAPARRVALALVSERRRRTARMRDLMRASSPFCALDDRDRALASRLALGATAASGELERIVARYTAPKVHLEPRVRDALQLAVFEVLYLQTPSAVAVSQGVELVRSVRPRAAGVANAVLRRVVEQEVLAFAAARDRVKARTASVDDLARVGGLPHWLCKALIQQDVELAHRVALGTLEPPVTCAVINPAHLSVSQGKAALEQCGADPKLLTLGGGQAYELGNPAALLASQLVHDVDVIPCDPAAWEVVCAAAPKPGEQVLEIGQGRGTKTLLLEAAAFARGGFCSICAVELDAAKSEGAARRLEQAGLSEQVRCVVVDGRAVGKRDSSLRSRCDEGYDLVFLDAPCTGTGTLARHAEIAWSLTPQASHELSTLQLELLCAAATQVAPGGRLVYATCSVLAQENERVVEAFLAQPCGAGFTLECARLTGSQTSDQHFFAHLTREKASSTSAS